MSPAADIKRANPWQMVEFGPKNARLRWQDGCEEESLAPGGVL